MYIDNQALKDLEEMAFENKYNIIIEDMVSSGVITKKQAQKGGDDINKKAKIFFERNKGDYVDDLY